MELYEKVNLHSHIYRCHHAEGTVEEYVQEAIRHHVEVLGISDHTPFPETMHMGTRMELSELPDYIKEIEDAREKYSQQIKILKGLECDYTPSLVDFYRELKENYPFDYMIGSVHFLCEDGRIFDVFREPIDHKHMRLYTENMLGNLDTDFFDLIAHPDLFFIQLEQWDSYAEDCVREMCRMAEEKHRIFEINVNGLLKPGKPYPNERFWRIVSDYHIRTIVNSDAHKVEHLCHNKEIGFQIQQKYHLEQYCYPGISEA
ncbi:MAG: histidinol-phosphatase [Lachnospiraceae bacterium]|nr:histidinol-phosphatase [Lachnospiraceae bacterium]